MPLPYKKLANCNTISRRVVQQYGVHNNRKITNVIYVIFVTMDMKNTATF